MNEKKDLIMKRPLDQSERWDQSERRNMSNASRMNDKLSDPLEKSDHFEMMS